jgi:hypothetical protein
VSFTHTSPGHSEKTSKKYENIVPSTKEEALKTQNLKKKIKAPEPGEVLSSHGTPHIPREQANGK